MSEQRSPRRKRRQISENVRDLHNVLTTTLNDADRSLFIRSLNQYQKNHNVKRLVYSLHTILNTPRKREIHPQLRRIIPPGEQAEFDHYWYSGSPSRSRNKLHRQATSSSLPEQLNRYASADSGVDLRGPPRSRKTSPSGQELKEKYPIKRLHLKRAANTGFGFSIRGGSEHGIGLYVSFVDENSISEKQGLLPGDHILLVNGTIFDGLTHGQAVQFIQKHRKLDVFVRSVGRIPGTYIAETTYKWVDAKGRQVSPPPTVDSLGRDIEHMQKSELRLLGDDDERKVNLFVEDGCKLGLMVRGGAEYGLGIYIAGVDAHSLADKAGLKTGEQILDVNGKSFINITHKDAIKFLKSTRNMMFTLKDVGKLPFAKTTEDKTRWVDGSHVRADIQSDGALQPQTSSVHTLQPSTLSVDTSHRRHTFGGGNKFGVHNVDGGSEQSLFHHGIAGTQLLYNGTGNLPSQKNFIAEQARQVLSENEIGTLTYYMDEYGNGSITVDAFVLALFDLLNSPAKASFLAEIRGSILAKDLDRYDELIMQREIESMTEIAQNKKLFRYSGDSDSLHSYCSTLSSFSVQGSISSRSSTKGSLDGGDSRPITPPHIPEVLPPNLKVDYDVYEEAVLFTDKTVPDAEAFGLPSFLSVDASTLSATPPSQSSLGPPPEEECPPIPILASFPRRKAENATSGGMKDDRRQAELRIVGAKTNGEATSSCETGGNDRGHATGHATGAVASISAVTNGDLHSQGKFGFEIPDKRIETNNKEGLHSAQSASFFSASIESNLSLSSPTDDTLTNDSSASLNATIVNSPRSTNGAFGASNEGANQRDVKTKSPNIFLETTPRKEPPKPPIKPKRNHSAGLLPGNAEPEEKVTLRAVENFEVSIEERGPFRGSVLNKVNKFNEIAVAEGGAPVTSRRRTNGSLTTNNRKSWDGVEGDPNDEHKKVSHIERSRDKNRSHSDTNLMERLPRDEQKSLNVKLRASQELFELHQQSRPQKEPVSSSTPSKPPVLPKPKVPPTTIEVKTNDLAGNLSAVTRVSMETNPPNHVNTSQRLVSGSAGEFDVEIEKSSLNLGLTVEGGSDTPSGEVRVKNVKEGDYAAFKCGLLRPGQTIVRVNGKSVEGMSNGVAVLTIRQAYTSYDTQALVLTLRDV